MTHHQPPSGHSNWERIAAIALATFVIIVFVVLIFYPPERIRETLPIIRFLAAFAAGISASLFAGSLDVEGTLPFNKLQVRAAGGFAAFVLVFFLFLWGIEEPEPETASPSPTTSPSPTATPAAASPILSQPVTLFNSYPTLALFDPQNPTVPDVLKDALNMQSDPLIFQKSPVFQTIKTFILETGNEDYVANNSFGNTIYSINEGGVTQSSDVPEESFEQSASEYADDSVVYEGNPVDYSPIILEFQTDLDDAPWTAFSDPDSYLKFVNQFPKLSEIGQSQLTMENFGFSNPDVERKRQWIQNVILENPDQRGLVGYSYLYVLNLSDEGLLEPCKVWVDTVLLSPYVKFIDVINPGDSPIQLESVTYQVFGGDQSNYQLTRINQRSALFQTAPTRTEPLSGVILNPNKHYIIPVEFGFFQNLYADSTQPDFDISQFANQTFYLPKPLPAGSDYPTLPIQGDAEDIENYARQVTGAIALSDEFLSNAKSSISQISIPDVAVGQVLNVTSMQINGQDYAISLPRDEIATSISRFVGIGSCPYLLVYDAKKGYWLNSGNVLVARNHKSVQETEVYPLSPSMSQIRLEEREPEITYIDSLSVSYREVETGVVREVFADIAELNAVDDTYVILHQGDSLDVDLTQLIPGDRADEIQLRINGFYEILG